MEELRKQIEKLDKEKEEVEREVKQLGKDMRNVVGSTAGDQDREGTGAGDFLKLLRELHEAAKSGEDVAKKVEDKMQECHDRAKRQEEQDSERKQQEDEGQAGGGEDDEMEQARDWEEACKEEGIDAGKIAAVLKRMGKKATEEGPAKRKCSDKRSS